MKAFNKSYNILLIVGLFILIYNPPIFSFNCMHLVGAISWGYLFVKGKYRVFKINNDIRKLVLFFATIFIYLLIITILNSAQFSNAILPIYYLIDVIPFGIVLSDYCKKKSFSVNQFLNLFVLVGVIQAFLSFLSLIIPSVQQLFIDRMMNYGYGDVVNELSFRTYGFSGQLTYAMPIFQALVAVICFTKKGLFNKLLSVFVLFSGIINARIAIVIYLIGLIIYFILSKYSFKRKLITLIFSSASITLLFFVIMPILQDKSYETYSWIMEGIKDIGSLFGGEKVRYSYFSYAFNSENYRLPDNIFSLIFGTGYPLMGFKSVHGFSSDIGYVNDIWQGGLVYVIWLYAFYFAIFWKINKEREYEYKYLGITLFVVSLAANIKGAIFGINGFDIFVILLYMFIKYQSFARPRC